MYVDRLLQKHMTMSVDVISPLLLKRDVAEYCVSTDFAKTEVQHLCIIRFHTIQFINTYWINKSVLPGCRWEKSVCFTRWKNISTRFPIAT